MKTRTRQRRGFSRLAAKVWPVIRCRASSRSSIRSRSAPRERRGSAAVTERRHVIVTGGSRGLGAAMIAGLLADGYRVSTCSRSKSENIEQLAAHPEYGARFYWGACRVGEAD